MFGLPIRSKADETFAEKALTVGAFGNVALNLTPKPLKTEQKSL